MAESLPPAKKSLGQCFLVDQELAGRIVTSLQVQPTDTVLEIGPGRGVLTRILLNTGANIVAVEIDNRLISTLQQEFGSYPNFKLIHQDFLECDLGAILPLSGAKVVGNLPYHLVSEVLFRLIHQARASRNRSGAAWIECSVLMMQKEVADRVTANPGGKDWSKISVFSQLEANVINLFSVPARAFRPEPKVDGGVVRLDFLRIPPYYPKSIDLMERMVRFTFSRRRQMLKRTLSCLAGVHPHWQKSTLEFTRRPETLTVQEWVGLADTIVAAASAAP